MAPLVQDAVRAVSSGRATCKQVMESCIEILQSEKLKWSNAFIAVRDFEELKSESKVSDSRRSEGNGKSLLDGIPIAVKDNFCTSDIKTTAASKALFNFQPNYDSTAVAKLKAAGAIVTGKTNMDEFGMGSNGLNSYFGPTRNPSTMEENHLLAGGSSSGSAVAVASGASFAALGTDTGGSVRLPAAYCGVVGLKPSYGRVSRWGLISYASSLDTPGILASSVESASLVLDTIAGPDGNDSTSLQNEYASFSRESWPDNLSTLEGVRIGIPREFFVEELPKEGLRNWIAAADALQNAGASIVEVSVPSIKDALPAYYVIASAEASSNLSRYDGVEFGYRDSETIDYQNQYSKTRTAAFGEEVKRRVLMGSHVLSSGAIHDFYECAIAIRMQLKEDFAEAFEEVDAVITPVSPFSLPRINDVQRNPVENYLVDVMTVPASLAGLPAMSVPFISEATDNNLTPAIQIISSYGMEKSMIRVGAALENASLFKT